MARIVLSIILLLVLVAIVAFNASYTSDVNLFGYKMTDVPTVAIFMASLVLGVLYSFLLYVMSYFARRKTARLTKQRKIVKDREKKLAARRNELEEKEDELQERQVAVQSAEKSRVASSGSATEKPEPKGLRALGGAVRSIFAGDGGDEDRDPPSKKTSSSL
jgi:uncharacterized integral membrane protein